VNRPSVLCRFPRGSHVEKDSLPFSLSLSLMPILLPCPRSPAAIQAAIHNAYTSINNDIAMRVPAAADAGSCAVTFVMARAAGVMHLFCANAGDCRAVLYTGESGRGGKRICV
jgi:serine/threonine protein phosphatase PrpC